MTEQTQRHRAGFVNIIGNPNVGKSTLMNALVGEKLSIVTAKAQTTRHRIMGIVNGEDYQIVYSDTPGILKPNYRLQQSMMNFVDTAIGDADIILYVTDTVEKGDKKGEERTFGIIKLSKGKLEKLSKKEVVGNEKGKLLPTDIGTVVNDFLINSFPEIIDYNFTANVEKEFDEIADGRENWQSMMREFYGKLEPMVDATLQEKSEYKVGERLLGEEPGTGKPVSVKIGRFGPMVQIGVANEAEKPRFAQLNKGQSIATITLEEALGLFKLPRTLGDFEGETVTVGTGRFGPYVLHSKKYVSIPKDVDPMEITLEKAIALIDERRKGEAAAHLKSFAEDAELEVMNGRFGPYLKYKGANYKLPKSVKEPASLTYEECMEIINTPQPAKAPAKRGRKPASKKA